MTAEQAKVIADILGLEAENISALPEDIKAEMDFMAENSSPETQEERLDVYYSLEKLWQKAINAQAVEEISVKFSIGHEILDSLDSDSLKYITDLYLSGADDDEVYSAVISADKEQSEKEFQRVMNDG